MIPVLGVVLALAAFAFLALCVVRVIQFGIYGEVIFMAYVFPFALAAAAVLVLGLYLALA